MSSATNRLALEASPYLLQHATNPVDWYPWGGEALDRARREDRPILLSVGYAACHWCHVMERESFEDEAIAAAMNEHFVCVKVDREERPDLDQIYQRAVQLLGRNGGWPLTVFLTPSLRPFFGGTYFPPVDHYGVPGFGRLLAAVADAYENRRDRVLAQAEELTAALADAGSLEVRGGGALSPELLGEAAKRLGERFDDIFGGFGARPKFPSTMSLEVLLRHGVSGSDDTALARVRRALDGMREGGICDQLGGGFHRYSTDERWLVPHFEKMLYDNALLLRLYADAFVVFGDEAYRSTAQAIVGYLVRDLRDPSGGFYASEDADSDGDEGRFYVFTPGEVRAALVDDALAAQVALAHFGVTQEGNFEDSGASVLSVAAPIEDVAKELGQTTRDASLGLERAKRALFDARSSRRRPARDEKLLASWNALAIGALAHAGAAFDDASMLALAKDAYAFVRGELALETSGGLRVRRHRTAGVTKGAGFLDDHAYLADAALTLYTVTGAAGYARDARALGDAMLGFFRDDDGFFFVPSDAEASVLRPKDPYDQAIPSSTAIACRVLGALGGLVDASYAAHATSTLERLGPAAAESPFGTSQLVLEADALARGSTEVTFVGHRDDPRTAALARALFRSWVPLRLVGWVEPGDDAWRDACPRLAEGKAARGVPVAYVCRGRSCSSPIADPDELARELAKR